MFTYIRTSDAANKWQMNERRVRYLALHNRIPGAYLEGKKWMIPASASKPTIQKFNPNQEEEFSYDSDENLTGKFNEFGGSFLPRQIESLFKPIVRQYEILFTEKFKQKLARYKRDNILWKTPLYLAKKFSDYLGNVEVYIKREDLNNCGSIYFNQTFPLAFLALQLKKKKIISESNDANYAKSLVYSCNFVGIPLEIYVGYNDYLKQKDAFDMLTLLGANLTIITNGTMDIVEATNYAFKSYIRQSELAFYCFHDAIGPHPFPVMVEKLQRIVGVEARDDLFMTTGQLPNYVLAPLSVGSNALGMFTAFEKSKTKLIACRSVKDNEQNNMNKCAQFGYKSISFDNDKSFVGVTPRLADLIDKKRVECLEIGEKEAMDALITFSKLEGFMPSLEDGYTIQSVISLSQRIKNGKILLCLTGNGAKDINYLYSNYKRNIRT